MDKLMGHDVYFDGQICRWDAMCRWTIDGHIDGTRHILMDKFVDDEGMGGWTNL